MVTATQSKWESDEKFLLTTQDVADILTSLGVKPSVPQFEVWNKLDLVDPAARAADSGWTK